MSRLSKDDSLVTFYTGFPSYVTPMAFFQVYRTDDNLHNDLIFTASPTSDKHNHVQSYICTRQIGPTDPDTVLACVKKTSGQYQRRLHPGLWSSRQTVDAYMSDDLRTG